jgi:precorrin-6B methylase 2
MFKLYRHYVAPLGKLEVLIASSLLLVALPIVEAQPPAKVLQPEASRYTLSERASYDGIGKWYLGREISHVMGHLGAEWLERPERVSEENPEALIEALGLKEGEVAVDIGAGSGYFTRRLSKAVGDTGKVYAVDIQPEMIELLNKDLEKRAIKNVTPILGTIEDPKLPENSADVALMVDVYHEFSHPFEMVEAICKALKPGGRLVYVEYRLEDPDVPIKRLHKMTEAQVKKEASAHPLEWVKTDGILPRQHVITFRKKGD